MEQQQSSTYDTDPALTCWASNFCSDLITKGPSVCHDCKTRSFMYLVSNLYLPKTLIPRSYLRLDESYIMSDLNMDAEKYLHNIVPITDSGSGIYAYSKNTGTGKTTVSVFGALRYLFYSIKKDPYNVDNRRVLFLNTSEFLDRLRKSFNDPDPDLNKLLDELTSTDSAPKLLILDDIGAEKANEWVSERFYSIINFRVANGLATSYTSNYSLEELGLRLGNRITSRIYGSTKQVQFSGKDHRNCNW